MLRNGRAIRLRRKPMRGARLLKSWPRAVAGGRSVDVAILVVVGRVCIPCSCMQLTTRSGFADGGAGPCVVNGVSGACPCAGLRGIYTARRGARM